MTVATVHLADCLLGCTAAARPTKIKAGLVRGKRNYRYARIPGLVCTVRVELTGDSMHDKNEHEKHDAKIDAGSNEKYTLVYKEKEDDVCEAGRRSPL